MPVARERDKMAARRRTTSDSILQGPQSAPCPSPAFPPANLKGEWGDREHNTEGNGDPAKLPGDLSALCCNPKGCAYGEVFFGSEPLEAGSGAGGGPVGELVRLSCSNERCPYSRYMHSECFLAFEEQVLSCLRGMSRARSWSEKQKKQNLWTKKGYDLVFKVCTCRCGRGSLKKDLSSTSGSSGGGAGGSEQVQGGTTGTGGGGGGGGVGEKGKRKRKKSISLTDKNMHTSASGARNNSLRSRSRIHSDSTVGENGIPQMQPFAHRTDYSIFQKLVPRHLFNSYHIKLEDDGYGAGDETRSFVLSSLAFHRVSHVCCVLCSSRITVYDKFPLLDGTFYLSPVRTSGHSLEVESKGDEPQFLSAVCLSCMVGINKVTCQHCLSAWNGNVHQIGTMYTYDVFAALPCCPSSVQCNSCHKQVVDLSKLKMSFSQLSSQLACPHCGTQAHHLIKPLVRFKVEAAVAAGTSKHTTTDS